jgi:hypothetical protein
VGGAEDDVVARIVEFEGGAQRQGVVLVEAAHRSQDGDGGSGDCWGWRAAPAAQRGNQGRGDMQCRREHYEDEQAIREVGHEPSVLRLGCRCLLCMTAADDSAMTAGAATSP